MKENSSMFYFIYHFDIIQIMGSLVMLLVLLRGENIYIPIHKVENLNKKIILIFRIITSTYYI